MTNEREEEEEASNKTRSSKDNQANDDYNETNDNANQDARSSSQQKQGQQQQQQQRQRNRAPIAAVGQPALPPATPLRQARPARPNLRRQLVVAAAAAADAHHGPVHSIATGTPIELASLQRAHTIAPKRPAHLPSRYDTCARGAPVLAAPATGAAQAKPNRYSSWAQMQHAPGQLPANIVQHHHLVVNPMRIVNLSEHTKSRLIKIIEALKRFSEQWFSHVLLLMFLALYACFGAYIFISFEAPTEQWEKQQIIDTRQRLVNESWLEARSGKNQSEFVELFRAKLEDYERLLNKACASGMSSSSLDDQWTFWGALFYSMTVFTTIGYGHLTPITFAGRVATMIYAIFGIPILLMVLADLGKLLTRIIKFTFKQFRSLYNQLMHKKSSIRTRKMISDNTNHCIGAARGAFVRGYAHIQPYNKLPYAFAKASSFRRRFQHDQPASRVAEDVPAAATADATSAAAGAAAAPDPPQPGGDTTTSTTNSSDQPTTKDGSSGKRSLETSDVIVTPAKQTAPVSPPITSDRRPAFDGAAHNHGAPHNQQQQHQHHHQHSHHNHHQHHHHHHASGHSHHRGRSQSPGFQSGSKSRKSSLNSPSSSSQKKAAGVAAPAKASAAGAATSVSRSSSVSSSNVADLNVKPASKAKSPSKQAATSSEAPVADTTDTCLADSNASELNTFVPDQVGIQIDDLVHIGDDEADEEEEDDFDIPVSFALTLLVTYMMFGAVVFSIWEGWNFFDSLYFVFISMSTIGFGDLVPQHPKRMIGTFIYLLFGLALTSMCINVVQEKIHATFLRAKMQIGEKMGLDLDQIMADDYYDGSTMDCEDDDLNSMAASQTNSSLACQMCQLDNELPEHRHPQAVDSSAAGETGTGVKQSRSRDSMKNKRRMVTGLPAHNISGHSLRRTQSKKLQRQVSPSSLHGAASVEQPHPVSSAQTHPAASKHEIESAAPPTIDTTAATPVATNQPPPLEGPLQQGASDAQAGSRTKLAASRSQPTGSDARMLKSLSSETGFGCNTRDSPSLSRHPFADTRRPSTALGPRSHHQPMAGRRSADSSRRSSVSQELNQLDDLIMKLSHCQLANERFGPLLGIPSSRPSSRSNQLSANNINNNQERHAKRGTSMINRPSARFQDAGNQPSSSDALSKATKRSSSVSRPQPRVVPVAPNTTNTTRNLSNQDALDELEAIKFSAV